MSFVRRKSIFSSLNPAQKKAVTWEGGHLLVLAGAGSGKTRVLTHRIAYLMTDSAVTPQSIVAMTFTNKAAGEMAARVRELIGGEKIPAMGTFHSLCARFLRRHIDRLGFPKDFVIVDADDQWTLVRNLLKEENRHPDLMTPDKVLGRIDRWKNDGLGPDDLSDQNVIGFFDEVVADFYPRYEAALKKMGGVDFGNLLLFTARILDHHPHIRRQYHQRFRHILVDEYQDTNRVQLRLLTLLTGKDTSLFVVGDEDQCIYGWRGACLENILDFSRHFPTAAVVKLEENYRSTAIILKAASSLVSRNRLRQPKTLFTSGPEGDLVKIWSSGNEYREAAAAAAFVIDWVASGNNPNEVGILYRINAQSRVIEEALRAKRIPYQIHGGVSFYQRAEIKDLVAYLRAVYHPADDLAFRRAANIPPRGLGETFWGWLGERAAAGGQSLQETLRAAADKGLVPSRYRKSADFLTLLDRLVDLKDDPGILDTAIRLSGVVEHYQSRDQDEGDRRKENLGELSRGLGRYLENNPEAGVLDWLDEVALISQEDTEQGAGVNLMTLHAAKGLEFPAVLILGLEEGLIPHSRSEADSRAREEERRLLYVGMTRAQKQLVLSWTRHRGVLGARNPAHPSPFLADIDRSTLEFMTDFATPAGRPARAKLSRPDRDRKAESETGIVPGKLVRHQIWGKGVVVSVSGKGESIRLEVIFQSVGRKKLSLAKAPLEMLP